MGVCFSNKLPSLFILFAVSKLLEYVEKTVEIMLRILLTVAFIGLFPITAEVQKQGQEHAQNSEKEIEFYAGISVGWDCLIAKRTEQLVTNTNRNLYFSDNKSQTANGLSGKFITGMLWNIPNTRFVLSPEIYVGQGNAEITLQESAHDPDILGDKGLESTTKQRLTFGIILRAGFYLMNCQHNLLYVLAGFDQSKFENKFALSTPDVGGHTVPTLFESRSKFLQSPVIGFGFEKKFNKFKVGIDIRYMNYSAWGNYTKKAIVSDDVISIKFKPQIISTTLNICYLF